MNTANTNSSPSSASATAISAFIFWSADASSWLAPLTIHITGHQLPDRSDAWSHMGLGFGLFDGRVVYFENLFSDGFCGPKPIEKLIAFHTAGGRLSIQPLDHLSSAVCQHIREKCEAWVGQRRGYFAFQLIAMGAFERVMRFVHRHIRPSPNRGVCSEDVARLLFPYVDLRDPDRDFDEVNPNSAWRKWQLIKGGNNAT